MACADVIVRYRVGGTCPPSRAQSVTQADESGPYPHLRIRADVARIGSLVEMVVFMLTVFVAHAYVCRRGGLTWD